MTNHFYENYKLNDFDRRRGAIFKDGIIVCRFCGMKFIRPIDSEFFKKALRKCTELEGKFQGDALRRQVMKNYNLFSLVQLMSALDIIPTCHPCAYERQSRSYENYTHKNLIEARFNNSGIGEKYIKMEYQEKLLPESNFNQALYNYNKNIETNINTQLLLMVSGLPGRGKTTAVNFILINAANRGYRVAYITANELAFLRVKREDREAQERQKYILTCKLVVIDDIGLSEKQGSTTNILDTMKELINNGASIILIRNVDKQEIKNILELATDAQGKNGIAGTVIDGFDNTITVKGYNLREIYQNDIKE